MDKVVVVSNLIVRFEQFTAVNGVSFDVAAGEVRGVLGGNGAGKSTTLRTIGGVIKPTSGIVTIGGQNVQTLKGGNKARALTGYCPDVGGLISGATPLEHVKLLAGLRRDKELYKRGLDEIERFNLGEFANTPVGGFSHGMMRRLSVALAVLSAKSLLILDEPYDGVDTLGDDIINDVITELKNDGIAVIVSTHRQNMLANISDSISVMSKSMLLTTLPSEQLAGKEGKARYADLLLQHNAMRTHR